MKNNYLGMLNRCMALGQNAVNKNEERRINLFDQLPKIIRTKPESGLFLHCRFRVIYFFCVSKRVRFFEMHVIQKATLHTQTIFATCHY